MNEETRPFWRAALRAALLTAAVMLTIWPAAARASAAAVVPVGRAVYAESGYRVGAADLLLRAAVCLCEK